MTHTESLQKHLAESLKLPPAVVEWLLVVWEASQYFDDIADGDPVSRQRTDSMLWSLLITLPQNQFAATYPRELTAVLATQIMKWQASDQSERAGRADQKSFVWRAGYYDIVLYCVALIYGPQAACAAAEDVLRLYGEDFTTYLREFDHG